MTPFCIKFILNRISSILFAKLLETFINLWKTNESENFEIISQVFADFLSKET